MPSNIYAKQPVKAFYTLSFIVLKLAELPLVLTRYAIPYLRQHSRYNYKTAVMVKISDWLLHFLGTVELQTPRSLEPAAEGDRFVVLSPAPSHHYSNLPFANSSIEPQKIGGVWYPRRPNAATLKQGNIYIHFHGGAFTLGGVRKADSGPYYAFSKHLDNSNVLGIEYRLSPGTHFPSQLQDAITAYRHVLDDLEIEPERIVLSGDSAGGTIVLMLLRFLATLNKDTNTPLPAAALLWSPWVDMVNCYASPNTSKDCIPDSLNSWGARSVSGNGVVPLENEYISPINGPVDLKTPIWVSVGGTERHSNRIAAFVEKMHDAGNRISLYESPDVCHDVFVTGPTLGLADVTKSAYDDAKAFLRSARGAQEKVGK